METFILIVARLPGPTRGAPQAFSYRAVCPYLCIRFVCITLWSDRLNGISSYITLLGSLHVVNTQKQLHVRYSVYDHKLD